MGQFLRLCSRVAILGQPPSAHEQADDKADVVLLGSYHTHRNDMSDNSTTLIAIKPLQYQGEALLKGQWPKFLNSLRTTLQQSGFEDDESSEALLLFTFNHPFSAITSIIKSISSVKESFPAVAADGAAPLAIILHLNQQGETASAFRNSDASLWEMLTPETYYISRSLKGSWELLMSKKNLPPCALKNHGEGLFKIEFSSKPEARAETLLAFRRLPVSGETGNAKECYFCGMKTHQPSVCPSKFLSMDLDALGESGYLPFDRINLLYKQVFQEPGKFLDRLAAGITQGQLKKDPTLTIFVSFLDINKLFQLRFLWNMTFSLYTKWEAAFNSEKLQVDNNNLQIGFDCLRVRQYDQAEAILQQESQHKSPKRFYATVGLAFLALERGRLADMGTCLENAANMATQEKEQIYIALLLSRYFELTNETWKARDVIKNCLNTKPDCQELRYRRIQLEVKGNFTEDAFLQLRSMMAGQRQFYMLVLLDPTLLPIQAKVEDILATQYFTLVHSSKNSLALAGNDIADLKVWFDKEDKQMSANIKTLENLQKRYERKSYFDVLDVDIQAKALLASAKHLREQKLNELYDRVEKATAKWTGYYNFWKTYPHKGLFKKFKQQLIPLQDRLRQAHALAKKNKGTTYHEAVSLLKETITSFKKLESIFSQMNLVSYAITGALIFGKKLVITEVAIAVLGILVSFGLSQVSPASPLNELATLFNNAWFQKKAIILSTFILSPIIALSWTLAILNKS